jgi:hypothetical protein
VNNLLCPRCGLSHIKRNGHTHYGEQNYRKLSTAVHDFLEKSCTAAESLPPKAHVRSVVKVQSHVTNFPPEPADPPNVLPKSLSGAFHGNYQRARNFRLAEGKY